MAEQSTTIRAALTVGKGGHLSEDTHENELTVTVRDGMNGWQDVIVTETWRAGVSYSAKFGFLTAAGGGPRWSYNTRPPQAIVDAAKVARRALIAAASTPSVVQPTAEEIESSRHSAAERRAREQAAELAEANSIISAYEGAVGRMERAGRDGDAEARREAVADQERIGFDAYYRATQIRNAYSRARAQAQNDLVERIAYGDGE